MLRGGLLDRLPFFWVKHAGGWVLVATVVARRP
jgi:hypothetical protein